jgi:hypothetical protein
LARRRCWPGCRGLLTERLTILPHLVEAVVDHVSGLAKAGMVGVYNRALYLDERRKALVSWADYLEQITR